MVAIAVANGNANSVRDVAIACSMEEIEAFDESSFPIVPYRNGEEVSLARLWVRRGKLHDH